MNDLTIIHLSDLHFKWNAKLEGSYPALYHNMLDDIREQSKYYASPVIIVVTGDLVNQGNFTKEVKKAICSFFKDLKEILGDKCKDILIIAGNHDKKRTELQQHLFELILKESTPLTDVYEKLLNQTTSSFNEYKQLMMKIYDIFGVSEKHIETLKNTYGVDIIEFDYDSPAIHKQKKRKKNKVRKTKRFCFISLNTAINSIGKSDYRNLRLGKVQLDYISKLLQSKTGSKAAKCDMTFVLAHHPVNWLVGEEENIVQNKLLSPVEWKATIYMCGHVHQRDAISWRNAHHSLTTLMTGFGWPDAGAQHAEVHLYSTYVFNLDLNSIDIYVRSTNDGGVFVPDFRFYGKTSDEYSNKIVYPIDNSKTQPYIELKRGNERTGKALYLDNNFIEKQSIFCTYLCAFQNKATILRQSSIDDCVEEAGKESKSKQFIQQLKVYLTEGLFNNPLRRRQIGIENNEKLLEEMKDFLQKNNRVCEKFEGFLQGICEELIQQLCIFPQYEKAIRERKIRCHLRYYDYLSYEKDNTKDIFKTICCSYGSKSYEENTLIMREMKWKSLIKASYDMKCPLLYEANHEISERGTEENGWKNFLTAIPLFSENVYKFSNIEKPYITLGISCKDIALNDLLRLFEFSRIDMIVGSIVENFVKSFNIDLAEFIKFLLNN